MTKINYPKTSPYSNTPQASWYIGQYAHRTIPRLSGDEYKPITPEFEYRPEKLAKKLYGTEALWWVFMVRNMNVIRHPLWDFKAETQIWMPNASALKQLLGV